MYAPEHAQESLVHRNETQMALLNYNCQVYDRKQSTRSKGAKVQDFPHEMRQSLFLKTVLSRHQLSGNSLCGVCIQHFMLLHQPCATTSVAVYQPQPRLACSVSLAPSSEAPTPNASACEHASRDGRCA